LAARELGLPLDQPEDVNAPDARARIAAGQPDLLVLCAFGALLRERLLAAHEIVNVHPSLLPRWRGAAPIERAIMVGDERTGVSIMRLTEGLDDGPVCLAEPEAVAADDTFGSLSPRLEDLGGRLLGRALDERPPWRAQPEEGVTYAERIAPEERTLAPARPPVVNERVVRALHPHIGARVRLADGSFLGVLRAAVVDDRPDGLEARGGRLLLGGLELLEVQPAGGRPMPAADFLRGRGEGTRQL
ncbi:MAG: methionyl-tRNA formyltransferase, partial [Actinomycetota bacterium]|nr:methionyl-tRNA formyltransferase [Actinomycetota bacterium]